MLHVALFTAMNAFAAPPVHGGADGAACGPVSFQFVGPPDCISLAFDGTRTQLKNGCPSPLHVDISVRIGSDAGPEIPPGGTATLRDLSAFTVGMEGEIHRAVAVIEAPACPAPLPPAPTPPVRQSWLQLVLAVMLPG